MSSPDNKTDVYSPVPTAALASDDPSTDVYSKVPTPIPSAPEPTSEIPLDAVDVLGLLGTEIHGGFIVEELVSSNGLSMVYRAVQPEGGTAALKCFYGLRELSADSLSTFRDRFRRITSLLGMLSGDHVSMVRVLGQGWMAVGDKEIPCMLLDWIDGASMSALLDEERRAGQEPRTPAAVFAIMHGPLRALAAAHAYGLTHRNIKPSNFYVDGGLVPGAAIRIMDYALARLEGEPFEDATTFLTPEYAAPEQFMGYEHLVGPWTDVFAMALVLIEIMLGGGQVMPGKDFDALRAACLDEGRRPTPRFFGLDVSDEVEIVFQRALEIDVHRRYRSGAHFLGALARALESDGLTTGGVLQTSGEFNHNPADYITRRRKAPRQSTMVAPIVPPTIAGTPGPLPAIITGETVISPQPTRTGNTVLAPVPGLED